MMCTCGIAPVGVPPQLSPKEFVHGFGLISLVLKRYLWMREWFRGRRGVEGPFCGIFTLSTVKAIGQRDWHGCNETPFQFSLPIKPRLSFFFSPRGTTRRRGDDAETTRRRRGDGAEARRRGDDAETPRARVASPFWSPRRPRARRSVGPGGSPRSGGHDCLS